LRVDPSRPEVEILATPRVEQRLEAELAHRAGLYLAAFLRSEELAGAEALDQPLGVPVLPALLARRGRVVAVELDELMDEVAADGRGAEQLRELRVCKEPVGVPRRPVGIVAVDDPEDDVVGLGRFVQQIGNRGDVVHPDDPRMAATPGTMCRGPRSSVDRAAV